MANPNTASIEIILNGERRAAPAGANVSSLLAHFAIDPALVAVELDRKIVRRRDWAATTVPAGAHVEVVQFVGGG